MSPPLEKTGVVRSERKGHRNFSLPHAYFVDRLRERAPAAAPTASRETSKHRGRAAHSIRSGLRRTSSIGGSGGVPRAVQHGWTPPLPHSSRFTASSRG